MLLWDNGMSFRRNSKIRTQTTENKSLLKLTKFCQIIKWEMPLLSHLQMLLMKCYLSRVELVHVESAPILTVQLVTAVPAIVLVVANVLLVHALPIAAVLAPLWARLQQRIVNIVGRLG